MQRSIFSGLVGISLFFLQSLYADTIYLHDGSSILGEIIESIPGVSYTLKRKDETIQVFKMEDVWKTSFEEKEAYEDSLYLKDGGIYFNLGLAFFIKQNMKSSLEILGECIKKFESLSKAASVLGFPADEVSLSLTGKPKVSKEEIKKLL
ncbi:MAG: hypothetical protein AB1397_05175 [bacterium]